MNESERLKLLDSARKLEEREHQPIPFEDPYSDMTPDEKSKLIIQLMEIHQKDTQRKDDLLAKVNELLSLQKDAITAQKQNEDYKLLVNKLLAKIAALEERLSVRNKHLYGSMNQKGFHHIKQDDTNDK